jgi:hypothetical protein
MLQTRATVTRLDAAVQQPKVLWGVQVTDDLKLERGQGADMEDLNEALDLIAVVKADAGIITEMVEKKMRSKRFMETHGVWNCAGGVLILPRMMIPKDVDDIASRVSRWNPNESPIENVWKQPVNPEAAQNEIGSWADQSQSPRSDPAEDQSTGPAEPVRMEYSWQSELTKRPAQDMTTAGEAVRELRARESNDPQLLQTEEANANNTYSIEFHALNATRVNENEWITKAEATGPITFTIRLAQKASVVGIWLLHGDHGRIFTQVEVKAKDGSQESNLVIIPPKDAGNRPHYIWLQHPIQEKQFELIFNDDSAHGTSGSAGLKFVALAGYVSDEGEREKKKKKK